MNHNKILSVWFLLTLALGTFASIKLTNVWWISPVILTFYAIKIAHIIKTNETRDFELAIDSVYYLGFGITIVSLALLFTTLKSGTDLMEVVQSHFAAGLWTTALGLVLRVWLNMWFSDRINLDNVETEQEKLARQLGDLNYKIEHSAEHLSDLIASQVAVLKEANASITGGVAETAQRLSVELKKIGEAMVYVREFATAFRNDNPFLALDSELRKALTSIAAVLHAQETQLKLIGSAGIKQTAELETSLGGVAATIRAIKSSTSEISDAVKNGTNSFAGLDKQLTQVATTAAAFANATSVVTKRQDEAAVAIERTTVALQASLTGAADRIRSIEPSAGAFKSLTTTVSNLQEGTTNLNSEVTQIAIALSGIRREIEELDKTLKSATGAFNVVSRIGTTSATQLNQGFGGILIRMQQLMDELRRRNS